jgi:hypothetical protein
MGSCLHRPGLGASNDDGITRPWHVLIRRHDPVLVSGVDPSAIGHQGDELYALHQRLPLKRSQVVQAPPG